jgi:CPA1 family monovalent cation:H+ antiporter
MVLLVFLLIAALSMPFMKRLRFPHSVFLVIVGVGIGLAASWLKEHSTIHWLTVMAGGMADFQLSSEAILVIFLPTLIFESSYNINSRELIKDLPSILMLAVPALLISITTVGLVVHFITGLPLLVALLFGTLVSATDPVAVIAIFKELGAPKRLAMLCEGESLFNDATAIVIFTILLGLITSAEQASLSQSLVSGLGQFLVVFIGGVVIGLIFGYVFSNIIGTIRSNAPVEIMLTTMLAYLSFIVAHHYFHVSGVMSTVAAGVLLGSYGRTKISLPVHEFMEHFWETMAFTANAVIFLCIGLLLPKYMEVPYDLYLPVLIVAIIAMIVVRAFSIFSLLSFMSTFGFVERISKKFMTVLWWGGGLRGAIAIALALSLIGSKLSEAHQQTILLASIGVVMFTLMVNALSTRKVIGWLGMNRLTKDELYSQKLGVLQSKTQARQKVKSLSESARYNPDIYSALIDEYKDQEKELHTQIAYIAEMSTEEKYDVLTREALLIEKNAYFEAFASGYLSEISLKDLQDEVDDELDRLKVKLPLFGSRQQFERRNWVKKVITPIERFLPRYTTNTLAMRYEKAKATSDAIEKVIAFLAEKEENYKDLSPVCDKLRSNYMKLDYAAEEEINEIILTFPEYVEKVVEIVLRTFSLTNERKFLSKMHKLGQLPDIAYNQLKDQIEDRLTELNRRPVEKITLEPVQLLKHVSFFGMLEDAQLEEISKHFTTKPFLKEQTLIKEGESGKEMFIIIRGVVEVFRGEGDRRQVLATLKSGDILGEMALISKKPRNASAEALSHGSAIVLDRDHFQDFLNENPDVKDKIYAIYRDRETNSSS